MVLVLFKPPLLFQTAKMKQFLTNIEREELLSELHLEKNKKYADRIRIILLLDEGEPINKIAKYFFLTENSVRNYTNRYKEDGFEGLLTDFHTGRSSYLTPEEQRKLVTELESKVYLKVSGIMAYVKREFGVVYTVGGMTSLLHQLGFSYKKPKGVPGKAKREEQKVFVEEYNKVKDKGLMYLLIRLIRC